MIDHKNKLDLDPLIRRSTQILIIAHNLIRDDEMFDSNLAADTFRACKLIHVCLPCLECVFDACNIFWVLK